ncbi:MAG: Fe-S cluster assembly protein SufD [Gammaproteobacteria bacterium]|nr:Fe-S cluster assembly protein SufD [Gammaproteobacteria bacterium]
MITPGQQRDWLQQLVSAQDVAANNPQWMLDRRATLKELMMTLPVINRSLEAWRYTSIDALMQQAFKSVDALPEVTANHALLTPVIDSYRIVLVNGRYVASLSQQKLPAGVYFGSLNAALKTHNDILSAESGMMPDHVEHVFSALNSALHQDGVLLHIAAGVELDKPLEIIYLNQCADQAMLIQPRNVIALDAGAKATLVERFVSSDHSVYFNNQLADIVLADDAKLTHYRLQDESRHAWHLGSLYLTLRARSQYRATSLAFGGRWARTDFVTAFQQADAVCELNGLYTVGDQQLVDFHLDTRHSVPDCVSHSHFKGLLYGKGRAVFDGRILVEQDAQRTDAKLSNDNLLLTRDAEVDTKPQLEIYADDVQCSHGTTVGQLDAQQIFYMRSRGIDAATARDMLCLGFANTVLDTIQLPALQEFASHKLNETLHAMDVTEGGSDGS